MNLEEQQRHYAEIRERLYPRPKPKRRPSIPKEPRTMRDLAKKMCHEEGITLDMLVGRDISHRMTRVRNIFALQAIEIGKNKSEIARFLNRSAGTINKNLSRYLEEGK